MSVALQAPKEFDGPNGDCIDTPRVEGSNRMKSFCQFWGKNSPMIGTINSTDTKTLMAAALCRSMSPRAKANNANNAKYNPARITDRRTVPLVIDAVGTTPR